jgi:choline dehydrogenase-like flavoprotein
MYRVMGTPDPLRGPASVGALMDPPPLSGAGGELFQFFAGKGLHPYRLPQACEFVDGCEGCQGFLCPRECKNDSGRICLKPALIEHGAELIDECEVVRLEASNDAVTGVVCLHRGRELTLRAELVALAAGAIETPRLLLNSASNRWPDGLANGAGVVGRNLMRHYVDLCAVRTIECRDLPGNQKELAFNDLYAGAGEKLGTVQSFGALPPRDVVLAELEQALADRGLGWVAPVFPLVLPMVKAAVERLQRRVVLASIMEDLPIADNRVTTVADRSARVAVSYRIHDRERRRIELFRSRLAEILRPYRFQVIRQAESNQRIAHACGTCRFGDDPGSSALDRWNRAHEVANLYVLDASFFPSSGGTNPALTIAANALRVADHVLGGDRPNRGHRDGAGHE